MSTSAEEKLDRVAQVIYDKKGFNILALDVREISSLTDYFIIAEGNVDRHVRAIALAIKEALKEDGEMPLRLEGERVGDWVCLDYGDIVIHLFQPGLRETYHLEGLWKEASVVDLEFEVSRAS